MYIILVYDIKEERVSKVMKICRQYLNHIQNSVFEGEISTANFKKLQIEINKVIKKDFDSVIIYKISNMKYTSRLEIGVSKEISNFL